MDKPKVAIVHDYLTQYGGAERTLEAIAEMYPEAPVYTAIYNPKKYNGKLAKSRIITGGWGSNFLFNLFPKYLTFLIPTVFEGFNLEGYDIIISSSASYAKGVITQPGQMHVSYIHTPPRFLYGYSVESLRRNAWYFQPFVKVIDNFLRIWDFSAAQRIDYIVTNSKETQRRIEKFYKRDAKVIYPPVDVKTNIISNVKQEPLGGLDQPYYLALGRLSAYKNFDLLIQAFNLCGLPLLIIGNGYEEKKLRKLANDNVRILTKADDSEKNKALNECLGLVFPVQDEDLGIVPIEAMAYGKPVLAHKSGGPMETVRDGIDGMFFDSLNIADMVAKIKEFDGNVRRKKYDSAAIKEHIQMFNKERFKEELNQFIVEKWEEHNARITRGSNNNFRP